MCLIYTHEAKNSLGMLSTNSFFFKYNFTEAHLSCFSVTNVSGFSLKSPEMRQIQLPLAGNGVQDGCVDYYSG